jgi:VCBS repeat-containing protein
LSYKVTDSILDVSATRVITIDAVNDAATIGGQNTGTVVEAGAANNGGTPTASGTLTATDVDNTNNVFQAVTTPTANNGTYGKFSITSAGAWTYSLDNTNPVVNALNAGSSLSDSFTFKSQDGTNATVTISINGASDLTIAPVQMGLDNGTGGQDLDGMRTNSSGNETLNGGDSNDKDSIYGGAGNDTISGLNGNDVLYGGSGNDVLNGGQQDDQLFGGSGDDQIFGNENDDVIVGGFGADVLTGNNGKDIFKYFRVEETGDTIVDFNQGADKIDLSAIVAKTSSPTNDAFLFGGEFEGVKANSVTFFKQASGTTGKTIILVDTDGVLDTAEMQITLNGIVNLTTNDFML